MRLDFFIKLKKRSVAPTPWSTGARAPHFCKWLVTESTVRRRTANKKLTKLYWPSRKRSPKQLIVLLEPKIGGAQTNKKFPALQARSMPPHFRSGPVSPPLSNSFRRHCKWSCTIILFVCIKYSLRDLLFDVGLCLTYKVSTCVTYGKWWQRSLWHQLDLVRCEFHS